MSTLYLLNYNNYYNRKVLQEDDLASYRNYEIGSATNINFNPNDGIDTEQVINWSLDMPNYCVVVDENVITSRWFVIDAVRLRNGQLNIHLHRDVVVDKYDAIINAPIFIEKATPTADNPLIFNSEQMTYNQIKDNENLLKDETNCPWIVGYVAPNEAFETEIKTEVTADPDITVTDITDYYYYNKQFRNYNSCRLLTRFYVQKNLLSRNRYIYDGNLLNPFNTSMYENTFDDATSYSGLKLTYGDLATAKRALNVSLQKNNTIMASQLGSTIPNFVSDNTINDVRDQNGKIIYVSSSQKYYRVVVTTTNESIQDKVITENLYNLTWDSLHAFYEDGPDDYLSSSDGGSFDHTFTFYYSCAKYQVTCVEITQSLVNKKLDLHSSRIKLVDAPYDMFCIPAGALKIYKNGTEEIAETDAADALAIASQMKKDYNTSVYDIQLLPYCPIRTAIKADGSFDVGSLPANSVFYILDANNVKTSVLIFLSESQFTFNIPCEIGIQRPGSYSGTTYESVYADEHDFGVIPCVCNGQVGTFTISLASIGLSGKTVHSIPYLYLENVNEYGDWVFEQNGDNITVEFQTDISQTFPALIFMITVSYEVPAFVPDNSLEVDVKIESETSLYRLASPNYASSFDFNIAKNDGINYINVDCTYKPYTPYIHLNPNFKNIYGSDFNDPRGLICGGDFSLSSTEDKWQTYQIQNKNYQLAFDRQIESIDLRNSIQDKMDVLNAVTGSLGGTAAGAASGAMSGGVPGAIVGGTIGAVGSTIGGVLDVKYNKMLRTDARDLTIDQFNYTLGNIQALPYTLNKVTSYTINNKIFPVLEHYTCTDTEKEALKNKLKYNGFTIMAIGKIKDYILNQSDQFIKGRLIRIEDIDDDFHIVEVISEELFKGGYF